VVVVIGLANGTKSFEEGKMMSGFVDTVSYDLAAAAQQRRSQLYRLETIVRVSDHGEWIAELDVYRHLERSALTKASQSLYMTPPPSRPTSNITYTVTRI
jgi:hypothetical protein